MAVIMPVRTGCLPRRWVVVAMVMLVVMALARPVLLAADQHVHLGGADARALDARNLQPRSDLELGHGLPQDLGGDAGVDLSAEEHVAADSGKAVQVGDAHVSKSAHEVCAASPRS